MGMERGCAQARASTPIFFRPKRAVPSERSGRTGSSRLSCKHRAIGLEAVRPPPHNSLNRHTAGFVTSFGLPQQGSPSRSPAA